MTVNKESVNKLILNSKIKLLYFCLKEIDLNQSYLKRTILIYYFESWINKLFRLKTKILLLIFKNANKLLFNDGDISIIFFFLFFFNQLDQQN